MGKIVPFTLAGLIGLACIQTSSAIEAVAVTDRGITYVSGGVGEDAEAMLLAQQKNFNLKLLFTLHEGNYLADVNVVVSDARGDKVIEHVADGPFFMAKLPHGQYIVTATYEGKTLTRKVRIGSDRLHTEHLRWPRNPETDFVIARSNRE